MPTYTAPVEDMLFLFEKLRDNKNYNELEKYNEVSSDLVKDILEEAAKINQNLILPLAKITFSRNHKMNIRRVLKHNVRGTSIKISGLSINSFRIFRQEH